MTEPLASIITPCLNPGERLARCLESVARQTYPRVEHIVVDGGSTDGTLALLQRAGDVRWLSEPDSGQTNAINKGFQMARGEVLGWLNADDFLQPRAIELSMAAMRAGVGWTYGDLEITQGTSSEIQRAPSTVCIADFQEHIPIPQPGSLISRWALDRIGPLDESFHLTMDVDLWVRLIDAEIPSSHVPEVLATFEIHDASKSGSHDLSAFLLEEIRVYLKHGHFDRARFVANRLYLRSVQDRIRCALEHGDQRTARALAADALHQIEPVFGRVRGSLLLARWLPGIAAKRKASVKRVSR